MPTDDRQIIVTGQANAPAQWVIPGNGQIAPRAVFAHYDGTGAATSFQPALKVVSDGGKTVGIFPITGSVAAGGSADVSWFPGVIGPISAGKVSVVGARIVATSPQTISDSTNTDLVYQSVQFDTAGMTNLVANNRILTATVAGLYLVTCEAGWPYASPSAGRRVLGIFQNGYNSGGATQASGEARMPVWAPVGGSQHTTNLSVTLLKAVPGDFFSTGVAQYSGASVTVSDASNTIFSAILLGAI